MSYLDLDDQHGRMAWVLGHLHGLSLTNVEISTAVDGFYDTYEFRIVGHRLHHQAAPFVAPTAPATSIATPTPASLLLPDDPEDPQLARVRELYANGKSVDDLLRWFVRLTREEVEQAVAKRR